MNKYVCFYRGKEIVVEAATSLAAQRLAAYSFGARRSYEVTVMLAARADGSEVVHNPACL
jgi:hypothetical protein